jgi:hypothetical protein
MDNRTGCLGGLFKLFLLDSLFNFLQRNIGFGRGGCGGCGCGLILMIIFLVLLFSIIFGTDWFRLVSAFSVV